MQWRFCLRNEGFAKKKLRFYLKNPLGAACQGQDPAGDVVAEGIQGGVVGSVASPPLPACCESVLIYLICKSMSPGCP